MRLCLVCGVGIVLYCSCTVHAYGSQDLTSHALEVEWGGEKRLEISLCVEVRRI